jgi:hypothetical protein
VTVRKRDELADPGSCLNRARDDEWLFVLLERDRALPAALRAWAAERVKLGLNRPGDAQVVEPLRKAALLAEAAEPDLDADPPPLPEMADDRIPCPRCGEKSDSTPLLPDLWECPACRFSWRQAGGVP